jgi:alpha-tubulin suppressor-like RCC1 family protein
MGRIFSWGDNRFGQLALGDDQNRSSPNQVQRWAAITSIAIGGYHVLALSGTLTFNFSHKHR